jgi:quercetin dioxygenase-like cupin family protein
MSIGDGFDVRSLAVTYRYGHHLEAHRHPWAQLIYARSGVMDVTADRRVWFVPPTRAIWIPVGIEHAITIRGEVALRTLYVAPERAQAARHALETLEVNALLGELIVHIVSVGMLDPTVAEHERLAGVLMDLIAAAAEWTWSSRCRPIRARPASPSRCARAQPMHERWKSWHRTREPACERCSVASPRKRA